MSDAVATALHSLSLGFAVLLLVAGKNIGTRPQRKRSWRLFMEHVAPRLAILDPDRTGHIETVF